MMFEIQPSDPAWDLWKGFCVYIQHTYDVKEECTNNVNHQDKFKRTPASLSLLLTIGGEDINQVLHGNGLSTEDILQFGNVLSKVEELCLLKLFYKYDKYKQSLGNPNTVNDFHSSTNLTLTNYGKYDRQDISDQNESLQTRDAFVSQQLQTNDAKIQKKEVVSKGVTNEKAAAQEDLDKIGCVDEPSAASCRKKLCEEQCPDVEESSVIRRSSRQIRVSSRFAENKEAIQNLLKPEITNSNPKVGSVKKPPLLCSICKKTFPDSKLLISHWKCHKQNKRIKENLPFLCKVCGHKSATYSRLKLHSKVHNQTKENRDEKEKSSQECQIVRDSNKKKERNTVTTREKETELSVAETVSNISSQTGPAKDDFEHQNALNADEFSKEILKCQQCQETFEDRECLLNHCKTHNDHDKEQSSNPNKKSNLNTKKFVKNKIEKRLYRKVGHFKCNNCAKTFKYERQLDFHMTLHTGEKPHICEVCGQGFRLKRSLLNHRRLHDDMCHIKCEFCPKTFVDKKAFENHILIHSGVKPYSCEACGKGFRRLLGLKNHQRLHKKEDAIKCDECDKTFVDKWGMLKHKTIHSGEKPFTCVHCGKMFRLKKGLQDHIKLHNKELQLRCSLCPRTFIEKRKLDLHLMAHKGEKPFICDKCGKGFMNSMNLKVHNRCHTGEKPYKCSFCERTFNQQGSLIAHERHHKGERPYVCDICGDGYITKSQLTVHTRKHTNERPYKCDLCDYAAYTGSLLKIHKVKHSDEKPFKCQLCSSAFKRQHHLEVHSKTHLTNITKSTSENEIIVDVVIHKCPYCNECFGSEDLLTSHIDTHEIVVVTETTANANDDIFIDQAGPDEVAYNIVLL